MWLVLYFCFVGVGVGGLILGPPPFLGSAAQFQVLIPVLVLFCEDKFCLFVGVGVGVGGLILWPYPFMGSGGQFQVLSPV